VIFCRNENSEGLRAQLGDLHACFFTDELVMRTFVSVLETSPPGYVAYKYVTIIGFPRRTSLINWTSAPLLEMRNPLRQRRADADPT
jgi:hypothetical protein